MVETGYKNKNAEKKCQKEELKKLDGLNNSLEDFYANNSLEDFADDDASSWVSKDPPEDRNKMRTSSTKRTL